MQKPTLTLGIIKPDAVKARKTGSILQRVLDAGFEIRGLKLVRLDLKKAEHFYEVHKGRPFYADLTRFMSSGPSVVMALEKAGAVEAWRKLMGATNPDQAEENTIRRDFGGSIQENAVHGSDSLENAAIEIAFFFSRLELAEG